MEETKEKNNFLKNIGRGVLSGLEYATIKTDDLASFITGAVLMPVEYLDSQLEGEVIKYLDEQSGYRNSLVEDIKSNRNLMENYSQANPIKGAFLKPFYSFAEQAGDVTMLPLNALTAGKGGAIANGLFNGVEYFYEQKSIYDKNISEYGVEDVIGLTTSVAMGVGATKLSKGIDTKPLYDENIKYDKVWSIKTDENKSPLNKMVDLKKEVGDNVDFKIQGEVIERIESGQTQSLPKNFHNGVSLSETIDSGVSKRLEDISKAWKTTELENKYKGKSKVKTNIEIERDVNVKGSVSEAMKPIYTEITLGQKQALGEISQKLVSWNQKNKNYDGITPISNIIDETLENIKDEELVKIFQNKNPDEKYKELSSILHDLIKQSVEIKSKTEILNKDEGFYFDTLYNKQNLMFDLYKLKSSEEITINDKLDYIKGQLKDIGRNVYIDDDAAKKYGLKKGGYFNLEDNPELIDEFYNDIYSTTNEYARALAKGIVKGEKKNFLDIALKWSNMSERVEYEKILKKEQWNNKETKIKNFFIYGKEKYQEILKKDKITKQELYYKKAYEKNKTQYDNIIKTKALTTEEKNFKNNYEKLTLEKLETTFQGYEKNGREIMEDVISTVVDERSGYNVFKNKFTNYFDEPESKLINPEKTKDIELGFLMEIKADGKVGEAIKESISTTKAHLKSINKIKSKKYDDLTLSDKSIEFIRNLGAYKLLFGIRYLREIAPNISVVNAGANKLGFKSQYGFLKGFYDMAKLHYDISENFDKIMKKDLSTIVDPYKRLEAEIFIRRNLENNYAFDKISASNLLKKGAEISGLGQRVSDVHRMVVATRLTTKAMKDEFLKTSFDEMSPLMRSVLKSNGVSNDIELSKLKWEIKKFKTQLEFDDYIINVDLQQGGKLKSIFEQFVDIAGKEFEPFEKDLTSLEGKNFVSKLWLNSVMMFKRYSMGAFSRAWKNATTYYDSNDILRYKFMKNNKLQWNSFSKSNWRNSIQGFGRNSTINFMKMSSLMWASTEVTSWLHGKIFGTSQDEVVEAKLEALKTDAIPIIAEGLIDSATNYIGYDVMFGGTPAIMGIVKDTYSGIERTVTAENLESHEKIIYGLLRTISPTNISRGIDNLKLEKPINPRLATFSKDAQYLWKYHYKDKAELEQVEGEFPAEKMFRAITDWYKYFKNNPEKTKEIINTGEEKVSEGVIVLASGVAEIAEQGMRAEHINYAFTMDNVEEREKALEEFGLDYKSQLEKLDSKVRTNFNLIMAFKGTQDPLYVIQALESVVVSKDKYKALENLLEDYEIQHFNDFMSRAKGLKNKRNEVARRGYQDNTEGYLEFLMELKKVMEY